MKKFDITDLCPEEAVFEVSTRPGNKYFLNKVTLRVRIWMNQKYGEDEIKQIFKDKNLEKISIIAYHLLKDKADFPALEDFQDAFVTQKDLMVLMQAMLTTIGLSEPVIKRMADEAKERGNEVSLSPLTGALSTTESQASTVSQ